MNANKLRDFRQTLYALKRNYGFRVDLYRPTEVMNILTGRAVIERTKNHIRKAIFMPSRLYRDFSYASTLLIRGIPQNLTWGGLFDATQRRVLIDKKELPRGYQILPNDYIILNHMRYELVEIFEMELTDYWILTVKRVTGQPAYEVHTLSYTDYVYLNESINTNPVAYTSIMQHSLRLTESIHIDIIKNRTIRQMLPLFDYLNIR